MGEHYIQVRALCPYAYHPSHYITLLRIVLATSVLFGTCICVMSILLGLYARGGDEHRGSTGLRTGIVIPAMVPRACYAEGGTNIGLVIRFWRYNKVHTPKALEYYEAVSNYTVKSNPRLLGYYAKLVYWPLCVFHSLERVPNTRSRVSNLQSCGRNQTLSGSERFCDVCARRPWTELETTLTSTWSSPSS
eukprot:2052087-Rhodomonas_salina.4